MNIGLVLIWVIAVIMVVAFVFTSRSAMAKYRKEVSIILPPESSVCRVAFNELPSVVGLQCCFVGENITASRYLQSLDMVVNPVAKSYHSVCSQYCTQGISSDGTRCDGGVGQDGLEKCIAISQPRNCKGPSMPVAAAGTTYFYPNSAGNVACQDRRPCV